jgi:small subunit ribosomal protein S6
MNNYELMVIFTPVLSDDDYKSEQKKIASLNQTVVKYCTKNHGD